jgi:hypothetical protein
MHKCFYVENFIVWRESLYTALLYRDVEDFDQRFANGDRSNKKAMALLGECLGPDHCHTNMGKERFRDALIVLVDTFQTQCFAQQTVNSTKWNSLSLQHSDCVSAHIGRAKKLRMQLRVACETDEQAKHSFPGTHLVDMIIAGLPDSYNLLTQDHNILPMCPCQHRERHYQAGVFCAYSTAANSRTCWIDSKTRPSHAATEAAQKQDFQKEQWQGGESKDE